LRQKIRSRLRRFGEAIERVAQDSRGALAVAFGANYGRPIELDLCLKRTARFHVGRIASGGFARVPDSLIALFAFGPARDLRRSVRETGHDIQVG
jgi:hypothetical protein